MVGPRYAVPPGKADPDRLIRMLLDFDGHLKNTKSAGLQLRIFRVDTGSTMLLILQGFASLSYMSNEIHEVGFKLLLEVYQIYREGVV